MDRKWDWNFLSAVDERFTAYARSLSANQNAPFRSKSQKIEQLPMSCGNYEGGELGLYELRLIIELETC